MEFVDESGRFLSLNSCPFTRQGSYLSFYTTGSERFGRAYVYIASSHGIHEQAQKSRVFDIQPLYEGERVPYAVIMHPTELILRTLYGDIKICFPEENLILFKGENKLGIRFATAKDELDRVTKPRGKTAWETQFQLSFTTVVHSIVGDITANAPWDWDRLRCTRSTIDALPDEHGEMLCSLEEFTHSGYVRDSYPTYEEGYAKVTAEWETFLNNIPKLPGEYERLRERSAYNLWSYLVRPNGYIKRPYLFMRKSGPASAWQLTFQSIAFGQNIKLGWDQMMVPFDQQSPTGQLPDFYSDSYGAFGNIRPPLQGWALKQLKLRGYYQQLPIEEIRAFYPKLEAWANWFGKYRTDGVDGLPHYEHSDESGMEDGSTFRESCCMVTPDLPAYLVLLFEELGEMAEQLGMEASVKAAWYRRAAEMQARLIEKLWNGERFVAHTLEGREIARDYGILGYVPVLLGHRLPKEILSKLIADLKIENYVLSEYGFNKEKCDARDLCDIANNMFRGICYHPFNLILISALHDCGEEAFAAEVASRYCGEMVKKDSLCQLMNIYEGGMPGGTWLSWAAGVYLLLSGYIQE